MSKKKLLGLIAALLAIIGVVAYFANEARD